MDVRAAQCPQTHRIVEFVYQVFNSLDQKGSEDLFSLSLSNIR